MAQVLITGMSGAGKTAVLQELSRRGQLSIPTKRRRPVADLADEVERRVTGHPTGRAFSNIHLVAIWKI